MTRREQIGFICELTSRLRDNVWEYEKACEAAKEDGHSDYVYANYLNNTSATKTAIKRNILLLRQELIKLSKTL